MNQSWVVIRSSSGSGLVSGSGASFLVFVVGRRFLNSCFKWPFVVAVESGRCLEMRSYVSPLQVVRFPFLIAWMNVEGVGLKHAACRNWANYFLVLFIYTMVLAYCAGVQVGVSGISHRPSDMLNFTVRMIFLFLSNT